ncbi:hypothetical protein CBR_g51059 [Chara braunii]|uniref:Uncharacterized protein n=1 Tax=Chara braunii TaxID=69332 RepID=A0A388K5Z0_CHABU|nr:hypothetical protein CBR_g51059 [Chara braunii]|eukprot:GBG65465.1 hypothetical protein CBR_g51059 [Chara braunii]
MKIHQDVEIESKRVKKEEEERLKSELAEEQRKLQEKKEREAFHAGQPKASASTAVVEGRSSDRDLVEQLLPEQEELKKRLASVTISDQRVTTLEEELPIAHKSRDEALVAADTWKKEALRPGNKRGNVVLPTLVSQSSVRAHVTPLPVSPSGALRKATEDYRELIIRHQEEVEALKGLRARDLNDRREAEEEAERLREALKMSKEKGKMHATPRSEFRARLDDAADGSGKKTCVMLNKKVIEIPEEGDNRTNDRETFVKEMRKTLKLMKKDDIVSICLKEGIQYSTFEVLKEAITKLRTERVFGDGTNEGKGRGRPTDEDSEDVVATDSDNKGDVPMPALRRFVPGRGSSLESYSSLLHHSFYFL